MLKEVYFIIVTGSFDRPPIICDNEPTMEEIESAILSGNGTAARVDRGFALVKS